MIESNIIMVDDHELNDPQAKLDLIKLAGKNQYIKVLKQFAVQRLPVQNPGGFTHEEIETMTEAEYEANREKIFADMNKQADPKKPVFAELSISENHLSTPEKKDLFIKRFGFQRFMMAIGLHGLDELGDRAYHQVMDREFKPYVTHRSVDG